MRMLLSLIVTIALTKNITPSGNEIVISLIGGLHNTRRLH